MCQQWVAPAAKKHNRVIGYRFYPYVFDLSQSANLGDAKVNGT